MLGEISFLVPACSLREEGSTLELVDDLRTDSQRSEWPIYGQEDYLSEVLPFKASESNPSGHFS